MLKIILDIAEVNEDQIIFSVSDDEYKHDYVVEQIAGKKTLLCTWQGLR